MPGVADFADGVGVPDLSYGWAKLTGEYLARLAHARYGQKIACYRPFSGYGEDQDLTYPFPSICKRAVEQKGAGQISVWGTGEQMHDFINISDCIEFVLKSLDRIDDGSAINLSSGELTSFKMLARLAANAAGYDPVVTGTSGSETKLRMGLAIYHALPMPPWVRRLLAALRRGLGVG